MNKRQLKKAARREYAKGNLGSPIITAYVKRIFLWSSKNVSMTNLILDQLHYLHDLGQMINAPISACLGDDEWKGLK